MTSSSLAVVDRGVRSGAEVIARVTRVRETMRDLMVEGVHYGKVPGTPKPSLWKAGAELLLSAFRIGPRLEVEDLSTHDEVRYRVKVIGFAQGSGESLGEGIGECSTNEEKHRWRGAIHPNEWDATPDDRRRLKFQRDGSTVAQVRTSPADLANTVLLMAVKRGTVNMTRVVTACSDIFDQDIEDLPPQDAGAGATPAAAARKVERASAKATAAPAAVAGPLARGRVKDVRVFGKNNANFAVTLDGDPTEYTTKDAKLAAELEKFKGTDHVLLLTIEDNEWNGKTYHNIRTFAVDPPPAAAPAAAPAATHGLPLTADDIPF